MTQLLPLALASALLLGADKPAHPVQPKRWSVSGTEVSFSLDVSDLAATRAGARAFSFADRQARFLAENEKAVQEAVASGTAGETGWDASESFAPLSVVGTLVSYRHDSGGYTGGAHPWASSRYQTEDVLAPGKPVSLYRLFPEAAVLAALKADPFLKKAESDPKQSAQAKTVADFMVSLEPPDNGCVAFTGEDVEHSFAFHHLEGGKVAVRIGLTYATEVCRGHLTQLAVLLPVPAELKAPLERAARGEEGFLMADVKALGSPEYAFSWEKDLSEAAMERPPAGKK